MANSSGSQWGVLPNTTAAYHVLWATGKHVFSIYQALDTLLSTLNVLNFKIITKHYKLFKFNFRNQCINVRAMLTVCVCEMSLNQMNTRVCNLDKESVPFRIREHSTFETSGYFSLPLCPSPKSISKSPIMLHTQTHTSP